MAKSSISARERKLAREMRVLPDNNELPARSPPRRKNVGRKQSNLVMFYFVPFSAFPPVFHPMNRDRLY